MTPETLRLASPSLPAALARRLESALGLLSETPFDQELEVLRCLLGGSGSSAPPYASVLERVEEVARECAPSAGLEALRGKLLLNLGRVDGALEALDASLRLDPALGVARRWRAQARLASGAAGPALVDLDALEEEAPLLRGLALALGGRPVDAERVWESHLRRSPESLAARALLGLSLAGRGRVAAGGRRLDDAVRRSRGAPFLVGLRGLVARQAGRLEAGLRDLTTALEREPSPWLLSHRADVLNRMGFYREALADLKRLSEMEPSGPAAFAQAANILFDQGYYDEALRAASRAVELDPSQPRLRRRRAELLSVLGRGEAAVRELDAASRLVSDDPALELETLSLLARWEPHRALKRLRSWRGPRSWRSFLEGRGLARLGRYRAAERAFRKAGTASEPPAERARLYAVVCRLLASRRRRRPQQGLTLCGIGVRHPFQATVEAVRALAGARTIYNNLPDPQVVEFLSLFPGRLEAVPRPLGGSDEERARNLLASLDPRRPAAFVTRIHPFIYRRVGLELVRQSRGRGPRVSAGGAVSLTELAVSLAAREGAWAGGRTHQALDIHEALARPERLDRAAPSIVYCIGRGPERGRLAELLRRRGGRGHFWLLGGSGQREFELRRVPGDQLAPALEAADDGCVLVVPPRDRRNRRRRG